MAAAEIMEHYDRVTVGQYAPLRGFVMYEYLKLDASGHQLWWVEPLHREPIRIKDTTTDEELEVDVFERLAAVQNLYNLPSTDAGMRQLLMLLVGQPRRLFQFVADVDLMKGGRRGEADSTAELRYNADMLKQTGKARTNVEAAKILSSVKGERRAQGTITKLLSNSRCKAALSQAPLADRDTRRQPATLRLQRALEKAVAKLENPNYELSGVDS
jgi:hypothetical protein